MSRIVRCAASPTDLAVAVEFAYPATAAQTAPTSAVTRRTSADSGGGSGVAVPPWTSDTAITAPPDWLLALTAVVITLPIGPILVAAAARPREVVTPLNGATNSASCRTSASARAQGDGVLAL
jgi:hypothetical protein